MSRSILITAASLAALVAACSNTPAATTPVVQPSTTTTSGVAVTNVTTDKDGRIDGPSARTLVSKGAQLVDVRTAEEYAHKHVQGAVNVPMDSISTHDFGPTDTPLVVYCESGKRSAQAAAALRGKGYSVYDLGGMSRFDDK